LWQRIYRLDRLEPAVENSEAFIDFGNCYIWWKEEDNSIKRWGLSPKKKADVRE